MESVITKTQIPKDLQNLPGIATGFQPPSIYEARLCVLGPPGDGKSTFLNSDPSILVLDFEKGGRTVADPRAIRVSVPNDVEPTKTDEFIAGTIRKIVERKQKGATDIKMIAFDTIDEMIEMFLDAACKRAGVQDPMDMKNGFSNGYTVVRKQVFGLLDYIYRAGMGWAVAAHIATKTVRVGGEDKQLTGLAITDSFQKPLVRKCEHQLFLSRGTRVEVVPGEDREVNGRIIKGQPTSRNVECRMITTKPGGLWKGGEASDVKVRVPLPETICLPRTGGFSEFIQAYDNAVKELTGETV